MRSSVRFLLVLTSALVAAAALPRLSGSLARLDAFKVEEVRLEGARLLTYQEALRAVSVPRGMNVWDDLAPLEERLATHPLVRRANVRRRLPGTLVLQVEERTPVALVPTPALVPVDASGRILPVDPAVHRLDLPLIHPRRPTFRGHNRLLPAQLRAVARELDRLSGAEPQFAARVSEVRWAEGALVASLTTPSVDVIFQPPLASRRLREGMLALSDAQGRWPRSTPRVVDLRFAEQVVVSYQPPALTD